MMKLLRRNTPAWLAAGLAWSGCASAFDTGLKLWGRDIEANGFAAQGFVLSDGNEVFGNSTDGTFQYLELGLNGTLNFGHGLTFSAQEVVRRAGATDEGELRLDYAFADYQFLRQPEYSAGVRAGKVKNYYGLYNDSRDVVFTRTGILLPDSVYTDMTGQQRTLLFASEGGQLYGDAVLGAHELSFAATAALDRRLDQEEKSLFLDLGGLPFEASADNIIAARVLDGIGGGRWTAALSYLHADFAVTTPPGTGVSADIGLDSYVGSVRHNAERFSVIAEYAQQHTRGSFIVGGSATPIDQWSEGGYVQFDYRVLPEWTAMARFDATFARRGDYDGSSCADQSPPADRHECFSLDGAVGVEWRPNRHWGVWGEFHLIDGALSKISRPDNAGSAPDYHWNVLLLMAGYRF